jgi:hypothetical protein
MTVAARDVTGMETEVICNARHKCGFDCPHAVAHTPYRDSDIGELCMHDPPQPCKAWQARPGVGVVRSRCRCVEVDE